MPNRFEELKKQPKVDGLLETPKQEQNRKIRENKEKAIVKYDEMVTHVLQDLQAAIYPDSNLGKVSLNGGDDVDLRLLSYWGISSEVSVGLKFNLDGEPESFCCTYNKKKAIHCELTEEALVQALLELHKRTPTTEAVLAISPTIFQVLARILENFTENWPAKHSTYSSISTDKSGKFANLLGNPISWDLMPEDLSNFGSWSIATKDYGDEGVYHHSWVDINVAFNSDLQPTHTICTVDLYDVGKYGQFEGPITSEELYTKIMQVIESMRKEHAEKENSAKRSR